LQKKRKQEFRTVNGEVDFISAVVRAGFLNELRGEMRTDEWVISILTDRFNHLFAKVNINKLQV
jgi:hypothetical protein